MKRWTLARVIALVVAIAVALWVSRQQPQPDAPARSPGAAPPSAQVQLTPPPAPPSAQAQPTPPAAPPPAIYGAARGTDQWRAQLPDADERAAVIATWQLIQAGGPFPHDRDGIVFGNFEKRLPAAPRGTYREYTVPTPGVRHRGARRLVVAAKARVYYTRDHYDSFIPLPLDPP